MFEDYYIYMILICWESVQFRFPEIWSIKDNLAHCLQPQYDTRRSKIFKINKVLPQWSTSLVVLSVFLLWHNVAIIRSTDRPDKSLMSLTHSSAHVLCLVLSSEVQRQRSFILVFNCTAFNLLFIFLDFMKALD